MMLRMRQLRRRYLTLRNIAFLLLVAQIVYLWKLIGKTASINSMSSSFVPSWPEEATLMKQLQQASDVTESVVKDRKVGFMTYDTMVNPMHSDHYSGMWWARRDFFVDNWEDPYYMMAVKASFKMFDLIGNENIYMTKDWLDFCVEHLSHYFKWIDVNNNFQNFQVNVEKQRKYMRKIQKPFPNGNTSAFDSTLALFAYYTGNADHDDFMRNLTLGQVPVGKARQKYLYMYSMATTIASLWQVGIRRVTVAGNVLAEPPEVREAFEIFEKSIPGASSTMELEYVPTFAEDKFGIHTPTYALAKLQLALNGTMPEPERARWIGKHPAQWKYIYFSEPDLILHTRPASLRALSQALEAGKLLAAHRFQLMQHKVDYPHDDKHKGSYLPSYGNFSEFIDLSIEAGDACCDAGQWWPGTDNYEKCGQMFWYRCGFLEAKHNMEPAELYKIHKRMYAYPSIRITDGMTTPVFQEHGRVCLPRKGGNCNE